MKTASSAMFEFAGRTVPVLAYRDFATTVERVTTFISNFGNWELPEPAATALASSRAHIEWFHQTGELVAIGAVPFSGQGSYEVAPATAVGAEALSALGPLGGATAGVEWFPDGSVRKVFGAMEVPYETNASILAVIEHGPRVHELLWGWHERQHMSDGWAWLESKLAGESAPDTAWH